MSTMILDDLKTVTQVANDLERTTGRIRQICRAFGIGTIMGTVRLLSSEDVEKIRQIIKKNTKVA